MRLVLLSMMLVQSWCAHAAVPILQISIQKCGSHMLAQCVTDLTGKAVAWQWPGVYFPDSLFEIPVIKFAQALRNGGNHFFANHLMYTSEHARILRGVDIPKLFIIRDPRDHIVSAAHYMKNYSVRARKSSMDDLLTSLIIGAQKNIYWAPVAGVGQLYRRYLSWINEPGFLVVRFEDLVGEKGGGDRMVQERVIGDIAAHLGVSVDDAKIATIADTLFGKKGGGSTTFRKGVIGQWKDCFTEHHKRIFKKQAGQILIDLGYERNFDW